MKQHISILIAISVMILGCQKNFISDKSELVLLSKTADEDPSVPSIKLNGLVFHSESFGNPQNPMLVVLHGGPGDDYRYLLRCKELSKEGFYVVFYDQRGTGLSQRLDAEYYDKTLNEVMNDFYDDLEGVIKHYQTSTSQPIFIFGHSWGGMLISAYLNDRQPTNFSGVIIHEAGGLTWDEIVDYQTKEGESTGAFSELFSDGAYIQQFMTTSKNNHQLLDYIASTPYLPVQSTAEPTLLWRPGVVHKSKMFDLGAKYKPDWTTSLKKYSKKVLITYGEKSTESYSDVYARKVAGYFANAEAIQVKEVGHNVTSTKAAWDKWMPVALNYLNSFKNK